MRVVILSGFDSHVDQDSWRPAQSLDGTNSYAEKLRVALKQKLVDLDDDGVVRLADRVQVCGYFVFSGAARGLEGADHLGRIQLGVDRFAFNEAGEPLQVVVWTKADRGRPPELAWMLALYEMGRQQRVEPTRVSFVLVTPPPGLIAGHIVTDRVRPLVGTLPDVEDGRKPCVDDFLRMTAQLLAQKIQ